MSSEVAFQAATRFGIGAKPGELMAAESDPRGWLQAQLRDFDKAPKPANSKEARVLTAQLAKVRGKKRQPVIRRMVKLYRTEADRRIAHLASTSFSFPERLVLFWSNHFTISVTNRDLFGLAHNYEIEAIRPHVLGRLEDMLIAVLRHPAMLIYLDNEKSFGPNARNLTLRRKGLNENLARETMELYTLGVEGGYSQDDVIALAKILTGWTRQLHPRTRRPIPKFRFQPSLHEPGSKVLLGKRFSENGEWEGVAALRMLARQPATARFIAHKLARHFVADEPPEEVVAQLARVYLDSGGNLGEVSKALVDLDAAWRTPLAKVKTPREYVISVLRLLQGHGNPGKAFGVLKQLGQQPFRAASPAGFPDRASDWATPDALLKRVSWGYALASRVGGAADPWQLTEESIGPIASASTRFAIKNAPSRWKALAFLLASPEFQRR